MNTPGSTNAPRPPRFLADEDLDANIIRGVRRKRPDIEFFTASEAGTLHLDDPTVLRRARELDLILITHDRKTMPRHFGALLMELREGETSPGIFTITQGAHGLGEVIDAIVEVHDLSSHDEWRNQIRDLPL